MKNTKFLCFLLATMAIALSANSYSERMIFNSNSHIGYISIDIDGTSCSGKITWHTDKRGRDFDKTVDIVNCFAEYVDRKLKVEFDRSDRPNTQHFVGWFSEDGSNVAGYFTNGHYEQPWFAFRFAR